MLERRQVTHHFKPERKLEPNNITNLYLCLSFSNYHALRQLLNYTITHYTNSIIILRHI